MDERYKYQLAIEEYGGNFSVSDFELVTGSKVTDIDFEFFVLFLRFRLWSKTKILVTSAFRPGDDGAHGKGLALDIIFFEKWLSEPASPMKQWLLATTWPFLGVGIYFDWEYTKKNGEKAQAVGLHVDIGNKGRPLRWLRVTKPVKGTLTQLYYYQNTINGTFYNKDTGDVISLHEAIKKHWQP